MTHFSGYLRREVNPLDFEFDKALHQQLRSALLIRGLQESMIKDAQAFKMDVVTDPVEIEKAFREDDL
jgi:hypothetical protein